MADRRGLRAGVREAVVALEVCPLCLRLVRTLRLGTLALQTQGAFHRGKDSLEMWARHHGSALASAWFLQYAMLGAAERAELGLPLQQRQCWARV
jgi:hypothetical protein